MTFAPVEPPETCLAALEWEHKRQVGMALDAARRADPEWQRMRLEKMEAMRAKLAERRGR